MNNQRTLSGLTLLFLALPACGAAAQATAMEIPRPLSCELTLQDYRAAAAASDSDRDGISNLDDVCPTIPDPHQQDSDGDGVGDLCDRCPQQPAPGWTDGCADTP